MHEATLFPIRRRDRQRLRKNASMTGEVHMTQAAMSHWKMMLHGGHEAHYRRRVAMAGSLSVPALLLIWMVGLAIATRGRRRPS